MQVGASVGEQWCTNISIISIFKMTDYRKLEGCLFNFTATSTVCRQTEPVTQPLNLLLCDLYCVLMQPHSQYSCSHLHFFFLFLCSDNRASKTYIEIDLVTTYKYYMFTSKLLATDQMYNNNNNNNNNNNDENNTFIHRALFKTNVTKCFTRQWKQDKWS